MELNRLTLKDKKLFEKFLSLNTHQLCAYAFQNIYLWKDLYDIRWKLIEDSLCIFFQDKLGCFLYLPPQNHQASPEAVKECFKIMDKHNMNREISRIENVENRDLPFYQDLGYICQDKPGDYLYLKKDLIRLNGNKFKSKRADCNYFLKHYSFEYFPFSLEYNEQCLNLFKQWAQVRKSKNQDPLYQGMLQDTFICLTRLLEDYAGLEIVGRLIRVNKKIKAFTFGFRLNKNTFCVLYEVADLEFRGLSQFIFRKFAQDLDGYKYINAMDDSGLANLKKVKLSYHPAELIPAYIIKR